MSIAGHQGALLFVVNHSESQADIAITAQVLLVIIPDGKRKYGKAHTSSYIFYTEVCATSLMLTFT